jgi:hypothetical protein
MPNTIIPPFIHDPTVELFNQYVNGLARSPESRANIKVSKRELTTAVGILETNGNLRDPSPLGFAKMRAFIRGLRGAQMTDGARNLFQRITGITPPDPDRPPIVALYSVTIDDAIRSGDLNRMRAIKAYAEVAIEPFGGGTRAGARALGLEAMSAANATIAGVEDQHKPRQVAQALGRLDAAIAAAGG